MELPKTIAFFTHRQELLKTWDPDDTKNGIPGSEESVIYLSKELANLGYKVVVFCSPPNGSKYSSINNNPRFLRYENARKPFYFDIAISCRMPFLGESLKNLAKHVFLWPHDTLDQVVTESCIKSFDEIIWLSKWQREQWVSINNSFEKFNKIYGNGIIPEQFKEIKERENPYSCIYGSNYSRGLEILLDIWPKIKKRFSRASLDIYYGWQHWGTLAEDTEKKMRLQIRSLEELGVHEHGLVGHDELNRAYENASLWTYPCIAPETFCITALRAQFSGAIPVIINGSALTESVKYGYKSYGKEEYLAILTHAMNEITQIPLHKRQEMRGFIYRMFTWNKVALDLKDKIDSFF